MRNNKNNSNFRIAIFMSNMHGGGAQRVMINLAKGIAQQGFTVDLVVAKAEGPYLTHIPDSVRLIDLKASRIITSFPSLVKYIKITKPMVMLCALDYVNIIALWARRVAMVPMRVVISEHGVPSYEATKATSWIGRLMPQLSKYFYPWADSIIAVTNGVADDLAYITGLSRKTIQVVYNPVVSAELIEKSQAAINHPWFEPGEPPVLISAGRLQSPKDFATLIQAFAQVRKNHSVRLLILGEGPERPKLEALVSQLGLEDDVKLPGFTENPYVYMAKATLFILSSRWESSSNVLVEAIYCGTPVIATDCPVGPREILQHGQYGQLIPVGDVTSMTGAIEKVLLGQISYPLQNNWSHFACETVTNKYLQILLGN